MRILIYKKQVRFGFNGQGLRTEHRTENVFISQFTLKCLRHLKIRHFKGHENLLYKFIESSKLHSDAKTSITKLTRAPIFSDYLHFFSVFTLQFHSTSTPLISFSTSLPLVSRSHRPPVFLRSSSPFSTF